MTITKQELLAVIPGIVGGRYGALVVDAVQACTRTEIDAIESAVRADAEVSGYSPARASVVEDVLVNLADEYGIRW